MKAIVVLFAIAFVLASAACGPAISPATTEPTPTPEIFIPLDKAIPEYNIVLEGVHLQVARAVLSDRFPDGCTGEAPACTQPREGFNVLSVTFAPRDLPEGNMLAYKNLPSVGIIVDGGRLAPVWLSRYDNTSHNLTLGFETPADANAFGLKWADVAEIPLRVETQ